MTSKKSFLVNMRTNIRRRIWLIVVIFLGLFFAMPVVTAMTLSVEKMYMGYSYKDPAAYLGRVFCNCIGLSGGMALLTSLFAVIAAIQGFSYMYQRKKLDMYMSVPVSKVRRFGAIYLNGLLAFVLSYLINLALSFLAAQAMGANVSMAVKDAFLALIGYTLLYTAVYHIAILAVMLTGNLIVTLLGTIVLLFYDGIVYLLAGAYMETFFDSFYWRSTEKFSWIIFTPIIKFMDILNSMYLYDSSYGGYKRNVDMWQFGKGMVFIAVVSVIALVLAYWCYTKKPAEVCGKSMAFPKTKPVIKVLVTMQAGLIGGIIFYGFSGSSLLFFIFGILAGTLLCHGVVEVIYDFDIRSIKNGWKSLLVSGAGVTVIFCIFLFDLFGYDTYVPEIDQVEHIAFRFTDVYNNYYDENLDIIDNDSYVLENMQITNVQPVLELAAKRMGTEADENVDYRYIAVRYHLKNGEDVYRQFRTACREDVALLDEIMVDSAYQKTTFSVYNDPLVNLGNRLKLYYDGGSGRVEVSDFTVEKLVTAYRKDLAHFTFTERIENLVQGRFELECIEKGVYVHTTLPVYPSFTNTIALLESTGLYHTLYVDVNDVEQIIVRNNNSEMYEKYEYENEAEENLARNYMDYSVEAAFTDEKEMQEIIDSLYPDNFTEYWIASGILDNDFNVTVVFKKDVEGMDGYAYSYYVQADKLPDFVRERTVFTEEDASSAPIDRAVPVPAYR